MIAEYKDVDVAQNGIPIIKWADTVEEAIEKETEEPQQVCSSHNYEISLIN